MGTDLFDKTDKKLLTSIITNSDFIEMCDLFYGENPFVAKESSNEVFLSNILLPLVNFYMFLQKSKWLDILDAIQKRQINRNQTEYLLLKDKFNKEKNPIDLFLLCCSCAKNKIRVNKNFQFNQKWGNKIFNRNIENKLYNYHSKIYKKD
jgi:site-specific DNA-adenine methylase